MNILGIVYVNDLYFTEVFWVILYIRSLKRVQKRKGDKEKVYYKFINCGIVVLGFCGWDGISIFCCWIGVGVNIFCCCDMG